MQLEEHAAVVFEDEELQNKIIEKYKKAVFQGYLLIHGINQIQGASVLTRMKLILSSIH